MDDEHAPHPAETIRSEERLQVDVQRVAVGRAVLRRRIVVEERLVRVRVAHEEADLQVVPEEQPVPLDRVPAAAHRADPELVLHREEIVITRRIVPVERVRLVVRQVASTEEVQEDLRAERVEVEVEERPGDALPPSGGEAR